MDLDDKELRATRKIAQIKELIKSIKIKRQEKEIKDE